MHKLIATIVAALALAGVGLASHTATSDASTHAMLPYIEQDNIYKAPGGAMAVDV